MKITKYTQSCLKIENNGHALLVDVGTLTTPDFSVSDFGVFDAILFTHSHADHFDPGSLSDLCANGAVIYGNADVCQKAQGHTCEIIEDGEELVIADFKVKALHMEHCLMVDGQPAGIPNTAFLINDRLLLPGDSTEDVGVTAEVVAVPVFGPDISLKDAYDLLAQTNATTAIAVHYDVAGMNPEVFQRLGGAPDVTFLTPKNGESIEV